MRRKWGYDTTSPLLRAPNTSHAWDEMTAHISKCHASRLTGPDTAPWYSFLNRYEVFSTYAVGGAHGTGVLRRVRGDGFANNKGSRCWKKTQSSGGQHGKRSRGVHQLEEDGERRRGLASFTTMRQERDQGEIQLQARRLRDMFDQHRREKRQGLPREGASISPHREDQGVSWTELSTSWLSQASIGAGYIRTSIGDFDLFGVLKRAPSTSWKRGSACC